MPVCAPTVQGHGNVAGTCTSVVPPSSPYPLPLGRNGFTPSLPTSWDRTLGICRLARGDPGRARPQHPSTSQRSCWGGLTPSPPSALQPLVSQAMATQGRPTQYLQPQRGWGQGARSRRGLHLSGVRPGAAGARGSDAAASHSPGATSGGPRAGAAPASRSPYPRGAAAAPPGHAAVGR